MTNNIQNSSKNSRKLACVMVIERLLHALLISDNPEKALFFQILKLQEDLEILGCKVERISFSPQGLDFNHKNIFKRLDYESIETLLNKILKKKNYSIWAISLSQEYLDLLMKNNGGILDLILGSSLNIHVFVFGSAKILGSIRARESKIPSLSLFRRSGVSKVTSEFKSAIIEHAKNLCEQ